MTDIRAEVVELTRALIRIDTSNPPGNETPAAELLAGYLRDAGVEDVELAGPDPGRLNLLARIPGTGDGPSLMLLGHTDVVPAPPEGWTGDPFGGDIRDGRLVGRGATDMKNELAARAVAFAALARDGARPAGDVVLVAEADEERNTADVGMSWLVRERPDLRCDLALNEGGGDLFELADGRRVATVSVGEKLVGSACLRVHGTAGHASVPEGADNPVANAATAIARLAERPAEPRLVPALARALDVLGVPAGAPADRVRQVSALHPRLGRVVSASSRITVTPTGTRTYEPANVIAPCADVICDCRALPGDSEQDVRDHVAAVLGDDVRYELELLEPLVGGTESPLDTPLYETLERYVAERAPGAELLPLISPGFTDSHWIRSAFGTAAYGFAPVLHGDPLAHGSAAHADNESIDLADLVEMVEFHSYALGELWR